MHTLASTHTHTHTHTHLHAHTHIDTHTNVHTRTHTHTHVHAHTRTAENRKQWQCGSVGPSQSPRAALVLCDAGRQADRSSVGKGTDRAVLVWVGETGGGGGGRQHTDRFT